MTPDATQTFDGYDTPIEDLDLSVRAYNCLKRSGLTTVGAILERSEEELLALREKYADARRTQIVDRTKGTLTTTDLLPQQDVWVAVNNNGDLMRQDLVDKPTATNLRQLGKGGQVALLTANTRDWLYLFTKDGRAARISVHEIPQDGNPKHLSELCGFTRRDAITAHRR